MLTLAAEMQADAGNVHVEVVPITGGALNPGPSIAAYAEGAELLVVGSRGIGAVAGCDTGSCPAGAQSLLWLGLTCVRPAAD